MPPDSVNPASHEVAEESEWPALIRAGNSQVFERMFIVYAPRLASFADAYVKSQDIAQELVQEVFLWAWSNRKTWNVTTDIRTYLYSATRNAALGYLKRQKIRINFDNSMLQDNTGSIQTATVENEMMREELFRTVYDAISNLPESRRVAVTLRWIHKLSYVQIAEVVGISPKAVEKQLYRALKDLKGMLEGRV